MPAETSPARRGLAARHGSEQILDEMIANADRALYGAKREGRDTTRIAV